jgi:hypothetical protein
MVKPLLNCLPMSGKDTDIWHLVVDRFYASKRAPRYAFTGLWSGSLTQGRRDAELMHSHAKGRHMFGCAAVDVLQSLFLCGKCGKQHYVMGWESESDLEDCS